jgi:hypothetical protein
MTTSRKPAALNRRSPASGGSAQPAKLWAWWDAEQQTYKFIYPQRFCVVICSPDGFERATREGKGKIMRVTVSPNDESSDRESGTRRAKDVTD